MAWNLVELYQYDHHQEEHDVSSDLVHLSRLVASLLEDTNVSSSSSSSSSSLGPQDDDDRNQGPFNRNSPVVAWDAAIQSWLQDVVIGGELEPQQQSLRSHHHHDHDDNDWNPDSSSLLLLPTDFVRDCAAPFFPDEYDYFLLRNLDHDNNNDDDDTVHRFQQHWWQQALQWVVNHHHYQSDHHRTNSWLSWLPRFLPVVHWMMIDHLPLSSPSSSSSSTNNVALKQPISLLSLLEQDWFERHGGGDGGGTSNHNHSSVPLVLGFELVATRDIKAGEVLSLGGGSWREEVFSKTKQAVNHHQNGEDEHEDKTMHSTTTTTTTTCPSHTTTATAATRTTTTTSPTTLLTASEHFRRFGHVGPYPQIWSFATGYDDDDPWSSLVFVLDNRYGRCPASNQACGSSSLEEQECFSSHPKNGTVPQQQKQQQPPLNEPHDACHSTATTTKRPQGYYYYQVNWYLAESLPNLQQRNWLQAHSKRLRYEVRQHADTLALLAETFTTRRAASTTTTSRKTTNTAATRQSRNSSSNSRGTVSAGALNQTTTRLNYQNEEEKDLLSDGGAQQQKQWAVDYYEALTTALEQAVLWSRGNPYQKDDCFDDHDDDNCDHAAFPRVPGQDTEEDDEDNNNNNNNGSRVIRGELGMDSTLPPKNTNGSGPAGAFHAALFTTGTTTTSTTNEEASEHISRLSSSLERDEKYCQQNNRSSTTGETRNSFHRHLCDYFDALQLPRDRRDVIDYNEGRVSDQCSNPVHENDIYEVQTSSPYQKLEWARVPLDHRPTTATFLWENMNNSNNTAAVTTDHCLLLDDIIHSCLSYRPQVHEIIVHYPASFLKDPIQRVLFVGGGDLVILHEILKYPSLELVIGMELDQTVVRSAFRHYGVPPHLDDDRVEWWFGDASKSLASLLVAPSVNEDDDVVVDSYLGTFDLVLVDLLSFTFASLRVEGQTLIEFMMRLLKPGGILVRQEDFFHRGIQDFAQYTVDLDLFDVPHLCRQSFTMSSNTIDFTKETPQDKDIPTLYYGPWSQNHHYTALWSGYRKGEPPVPDSPKARSQNRFSTLVILEAEDIALVSIHDSSVVGNTIYKAIEKAGLTNITVLESSPTTTTSEFFEQVFLFDHGYVVARTWPFHRYMALDLLLWNRILNKNGGLWLELRATLGGGKHALATTSFFRVTTGGMFGIENNTTANMHTKEQVGTINDKTVSSSTARQQRLETNDLEVALSTLATLAMGHKSANKPVFVVVCGVGKSSCFSTGTHILSKEFDTIPLWPCPDLVVSKPTNGTDQADSYNLKRQMVDCERQTESTLRAALKTRISGVLLDQDAPIDMGQILHKIFNRTVNRHELLAEDFVFLAPYFMPKDLSPNSWRDILFDRFRTEIIQFNPVFQTTVLFRRSDSREGSLSVGVLSVGDTSFYEHLLDCLSQIKETSGLQSEIQKSTVGFTGHVPDFRPTAVFSNHDYDMEPSRRQYLSQRPVGVQLVLQFEAVHPQAPIFTGALVMINDDDEADVASLADTWSQGRVLGVDYETATYHVEKTILRERLSVGRKSLRVINDYSAISPLELGEPVLLLSGEAWYHGVVTVIHNDGTYQVQAFDGDVFILRREHLVRFTEELLAQEEPVRVDALKKSFEGALHHLDPLQVSHRSQWRSVGDGCIFTGLFAGGGIVASWDGRIHIDVNIFLEGETGHQQAAEAVEEILFNAIPNLSRIQYDLHPRGFGRVVNFKQDLESMVWFGAEDIEREL
ncbi:hypothetical protein ACA910_001814 [Epithemia clementina (nom. ined.)]